MKIEIYAKRHPYMTFVLIFLGYKILLAALAGFEQGLGIYGARINVIEGVVCYIGTIITLQRLEK